MSYNPNQMLNDPLAMLAPGRGKPRPETPQTPQPPPPFDPAMYVNAYGRLGMLSIDNVADLGCGNGNFVSVMVARKHRPEMYVGIDLNHQRISTAKAAYPGWKFIYGDFTDPRVRAEYERYGAFLMLNLVDAMEDDIGFLAGMPEGKPLVFSMPKSAREGSLHFLADNREIHDRYSSFLSIKSIGRFRDVQGDDWNMILASRW